MPRWLAYTSAGVLLCAGVACFLAAAAEWGDRAALVDPLPGEAAEQAGFVLMLAAVGAVNIVASLAIVLLRLQITWWLVAGLQAALVVFCVFEGMQTDPPGWVAFSSLPLVTLLLLVGLRFVSARLRPTIRATTT